MPPSIHVIRNVPRIPGKIVFGPGAYSDLVASDETAEKPIVAGVWNLQDVTEPTPAWDAEWDEVKYVLEGEMTLKDESTGQEIIATAGDYVWFPVGARTSLVRSKNVTTLYFEQRHIDRGLELSALGNKLRNRLSALVEWFTETNPKSAKEAKEAALVLPGGNTRTVLHQTPFPLVLQSGQGAYVTSQDGAEYLDFVSEYSAALFGHSHPKIIEAVQEALGRGLMLGSAIGKEAELGKAIQKRFPSMELMRFTNTGTEANTMALVASVMYSRRKEILVFNNGYHGGTITFPGGRNPPTNLPHQFLIGTYNDIEATRPLLHHGIGTILVEPMQSAGGLIPATREFLQFLREAANTFNAVLIFDEVVTSRLNYNGLQGYHDVIPDMTTLGKYIGGGFSFGCFGGKREIMRQFDPTMAGHLSHSGTFNNNVFTMTVGIAASKLVTPEEIQRINTLGDQTRMGFNALAQERQLVDVNATGFGSAVGVHFEGRLGHQAMDVFYFEMLKRGIVIGRRGFVMFNLMHTQEHVDRFLQAAAEILDSFTS